MLIKQYTIFWRVESQAGGGGYLIISYIRRLGSFFGVQNLNFNIFWGYKKN